MFPQEEWSFALILFVTYDSLVFYVFVRVCVCLCACVFVGIRSKMALYSPNIAGIVFFRVCAYPPTWTPVFLITVLINRLKSTLTYLLTSLSTDLSARGELHAGAGDLRKHSRTFFKGAWGGSGCGWKDAFSLDLRRFPPITRHSHKSSLVTTLGRRLHVGMSA